MTNPGLPELALSVRQPWAWAIIHAGKDIENRNWRESGLLRRRGRIAIHASKWVAFGEYESAAEFMWQLGIFCPQSRDVARGGIIGSVEVVDVVDFSLSVWFFGPRGLVLRDPSSCPFIPARGALGYFKWAAQEAPQNSCVPEA